MPKHKKTTISFKIESDIYEKFKVLAYDDNRSVAMAIRGLIRNIVEQYSGKGERTK